MESWSGWCHQQRLRDSPVRTSTIRLLDAAFTAVLCAVGIASTRLSHL